VPRAESLEGRQLLSAGLAASPRHVAPAAVELRSRDGEPPRLTDAPSTLKFPDQLTWHLNDLKGNPRESNLGKKYMLLSKAYTNFKKVVTAKPAMTVASLPNAPAYALTTAQDPAYFRKDFIDHGTQAAASGSTYYSYDPTPFAEDPRNQFWVDFANKVLGGGVYSNGFAQEEVMFLETPELANAAGLPANVAIRTRTGTPGQEGVMQGSPDPKVFLNANRVMQIKNAIDLGNNTSPINWQKITAAQLDAYAVPLAAPQKFNVLAIAAPKLSSTNPPIADPNTIKDLYNTFLAGFTLAQQREGVTNKPVRIHTGPVGAGVFHNDRTVVYVLQNLAARQVGGINLTFWGGYTQAQVDAANRDYVQPILNAWGRSSDKSVGNLLRIASEQLASVGKYQPGSYVPVFAYPTGVQNWVGQLNARVDAIMKTNGWAGWVKNVGDNVHTTIDDTLLDKAGTTSHDYAAGEEPALLAQLNARSGKLVAMINAAQQSNPNNRLTFQGLTLGYDTTPRKAGYPQEVYLIAKFGKADQATLNRIAGASRSDWHVTVGHFVANSASEFKRDSDRLATVAKDTRLRQVLAQAPTGVRLSAVHVVRADNVNAQYPSYRVYAPRQ
jgi:hypothetical protein